MVALASSRSRSTTRAGPTRADSGLAQDDAAADAVKQRHPEFTLEVGDRLRQRWLGHHQMLRGAAETVVIDHREEEFQLPDVHRRTSRLRR